MDLVNPPAPAETSGVSVARERLGQLERSRDVLLGGDEVREEEVEASEAGEGQSAPSLP
jgi:hypothetical protein